MSWFMGLHNLPQQLRRSLASRSSYSTAQRYPWQILLPSKLLAWHQRLVAHLQALADASDAEVMAEEVVQQVIQQAVVEQQPMEARAQQHLPHHRLQ